MHHLWSWDKQMEKDSWLKGDQVCFEFVWSPSTSCPGFKSSLTRKDQERDSNQQQTTSGFKPSLASFEAINLRTANPSASNQLCEDQIWDWYNFSAVWFCVKCLQLLIYFDTVPAAWEKLCKMIGHNFFRPVVLASNCPMQAGGWIETDFWSFLLHGSIHPVPPF